MIKCEKGHVEIQGAKPIVMAEFATLVNVLYHDIFIGKDGMEPEEAKELIFKSFEDGISIREQNKADLAEALDTILDKLISLIERECKK